MAEERIGLLEAARKGEEPSGDWLREVVHQVVRVLMEAEVSARSGPSATSAPTSA